MLLLFLASCIRVTLLNELSSKNIKTNVLSDKYSQGLSLSRNGYICLLRVMSIHYTCLSCPVCVCLCVCVRMCECVRVCVFNWAQYSVSISCQTKIVRTARNIKKNELSNRN